MSILAVNPSPGQVTPMDGHTYYSHANYTTCRTAATGSISGESTSDRDCQTSKNLFNPYIIDRLMFGFDTSIIAGGTINSAVLSLYVTSKFTVNATSLQIVSAAPALTNIISNNDYDQYGVTVFSTILINDLILSDFNVFTLNANGISSINTGGYTFFGVRTSLDIAGGIPTGTNRAKIDFAESSNLPELKINYDTAVSFQQYRMII